MNRKPSLSKRLTAYAMLFCMGAQPAFAGVTDISLVPLSSSSNASVLPNLMFILDDSGSMLRDFLPDFVADSLSDNNTTSCMVRSDGSPDCLIGDPPFNAGGVNGFNGVYYDPTIYYAPALGADGKPLINPPTGVVNETSLPPDAYLGGTNVNVTTNATERRYCNPNSVCKRNGDDGAGNLVGGVNDAGTTLAAGQFPYRSHASNSSTQIFGLPEMMTQGTFSRIVAGTTVEVATIEPHGMAVNDRILITGTSNFNNGDALVNSIVNANTFRVASGASSATAQSGSLRKHSTGTANRTGNTITVTSNGHGLVVGDRINTLRHTLSAFNISNANVTAVTANTFQYTSSGSGTVATALTLNWVRNGLYNNDETATSNPIAFRITPIEYCTDVNLTTCTQALPPAAVPPVGFPFPAYLRYCKSRAEAIAPGAVSGSTGTPATARCQGKYLNTHKFPRYGWFNRENIKSGVSFTGRPNRIDCASAPTCSYAEEIKNYARWYTYYRTRMQMMKAATGRAFLKFISNPGGGKPDSLRVGFITINPGSSVDANKYLKIDNFDTTHAPSWYTKLYNQNPSAFSGTPLRAALSRAGWIFAGKMNTGLTNGILAADDPIQQSCQRNFSILTTDGYWNGSTGQDLNASEILNHDNVDNQVIAPYTEYMVSRASGTYDGNLLSGTTAGSSAGGRGTLADVALYYYKTDLRDAAFSNQTNALGTNVATNNVPTKVGNKDFVTHQHMVTFSVGIVDGLMRYQSDYEIASTGDFANIKSGSAGACFWSGAGACNWPSPQQDELPAIDDLWHAAVNGRGTYYSARDPNTLSIGLEGALSALNAQMAAAAASATSSPNITQTDRQIFSTTYQTDTWAGKIVAQDIDPATGNVSPTILWTADTLLLSKVTAVGDTRSIYTFDSGAANKIEAFTWGNLAPAQQTYLTNKCSPITSMTQCSTLTPTQLTDANTGTNLLAFLRGATGMEGAGFRDRRQIDPATGAAVQTILGDTINARPQFVRSSTVNYGLEGTPNTHNAFRASVASRSPRLYVGANDGYLHAFHGDTGEERWAYLPSFLMPNLYALADTGYSSQHRFFVDGSPEVAEVLDTVAGVWKTILVGGLNGGGRGFYAIDITSPDSPKGLWEFCSDSTLCAVNDADLGLSYGNPVIGKRASDGKWVVVVTSGLNNVTPGNGRGYFYVLDAISGAILDKVEVNNTVGDTTTPSGLMKINAAYDSANTSATFRTVYGGDQLGNVWRLDMTTSPPTPALLASLQDDAGRKQPISTEPVLTKIGGQIVVYIGTGRYLGSTDLSDPGLASGIAWQQSLYAFADSVAGYGASALRLNSQMVKQDLTIISPTQRGTTQNMVNWGTGPSNHIGWYLDFNPGATATPPGASPGERVNIDMDLVLGTLVVTTNVPVTGGGCTVGGDSWQYQLDYKSGSFLANSSGQVAGQYLGNVITVGIAVIQLPSGAIKGIATGADTGKSTVGVQISAGGTGAKRFSYRER